MTNQAVYMMAVRAKSGAIRLLYGICIFFAFLLLLVAIFTPSWRSYRGWGAPDFGLVTYECGDGNRKVADWDCSRWFQSKWTFERVTLGLLIVAAIVQALCIGVFLALFSPRMRMGFSAAGLCFMAFLFIIAAVVVYGTRIQAKYAYMTSTSYELLADVSLGYSYYLAIASAIFTVLAAGAAGGTVSALAAEVQDLH